MSDENEMVDKEMAGGRDLAKPHHGKVLQKVLKDWSLLNILCFLYSSNGACFLTFKEPLTMTGNGYFAA